MPESVNKVASTKEKIEKMPRIFDLGISAPIEQTMKMKSPKNTFVKMGIDKESDSCG